MIIVDGMCFSIHSHHSQSTHPHVVISSFRLDNTSNLNIAAIAGGIVGGISLTFLLGIFATIIIIIALRKRSS